MIKLAVLVSGTGTILEAMLARGLKVSLVLADRPCRGLEIAEAAGVPTELVPRKGVGQTFDRPGFTRKVVEKLQARDIGLVAMSGFMTVFTAEMFEHYDGRITNTHPSLLPSFKGDHAVRDALQYGVKLTSCTIHLATLDLDAGPILAQASVPVLPGDTPEILQERIKEQERVLYPETILQFMAELRQQRESV